jgi:hypothetical protein
VIGGFLEMAPSLSKEQIFFPFMLHFAINGPMVTVLVWCLGLNEHGTHHNPQTVCHLQGTQIVWDDGSTKSVLLFASVSLEAVVVVMQR